MTKNLGSDLSPDPNPKTQPGGNVIEWSGHFVP